METAEAFQILGLSPSATEQEIEARFRSLAQERHPDQGGSKQEMQQLNHAREVALASTTLSRALVPADVVRDLVVATTTALAARSSVVHDLQTVSAQIKQTLTNRLRAFRQLSTLLGGITAGAFFLGKNLPDQYFKTAWKSSPQMPGMLQFTVLTIGMYSAVAYWYLANRIERAERLTEQLGAHLSVRPYYVSIVGEITHGTDNWTFRDLEHYVTD